MNILIFGANGNVGRLVVAEALKRGHNVTAFVHGAAPDPAANLSVVNGDIYNRESVDAAVPGHEIIISTLGSWGTKDKNVLSTAMGKIVPAAEANGVQRIISLTGNVAGAPGDKNTLTSILSRALFNIVQPKILRDGEDHITILANSSLAWSVVRSPVMRSGNSANYKLSSKSASLRVNRVAVAHAMMDLAESREWLQAAPYIRQD